MFEQRLKDAQLQIEADLSQRLENGDGVPARLQAAMHHALIGGGKRFRPFLVLESARLFNADPALALCVASALEAVHCYSLVHDDLPAMDNDDVRRGRPTVWRAFDDWTAILAGDGLLTLAFQWLAEGLSGAVAGRMIAELAAAAGPAGMVGGQALDLAAEKIPNGPTLSVAAVRKLHAMKTGALIRFACRSGPLLADAPPQDLAWLTAYGEALGLAFQIADDVLDATGDATVVGKAVAKDTVAGKATAVSLSGLADACRALEMAQADARAAIAAFGVRAEVLAAAVDFVGNRRS